MEVHIYKGSRIKSVILEQFFTNKRDTTCFVYYDPSRPFPTHIDNIIMADRSVISIDTMIAGIRMLAESGVTNFVADSVIITFISAPCFFNKLIISKAL